MFVSAARPNTIKDLPLWLIFYLDLIPWTKNQEHWQVLIIKNMRKPQICKCPVLIWQFNT